MESTEIELLSLDACHVLNPVSSLQFYYLLQVVPSCFQKCCILTRPRDVILGQNVRAASCKGKRLFNYILINTTVVSRILKINEFDSSKAKFRKDFGIILLQFEYS